MGKINYEKIKNVIANKEQYLNSTYVKKHKSMFLKGAIGVVVVVALTFNVALGYFNEDTSSEGELENLDQIEMEQEDELVEETKETIIVDIGGAVATPMVVELPMGARINDAIKAAGGTTKKADLSNVNRAQVLEDGQKIFIPLKSVLSKNPNGNGNSSLGENQFIGDNFKTEKVNLNTASSEELRTLDGVGPATAEKIIRYRENDGPFKKIEDIKNVDGIGDKTFEKLKDYIVV